MRATVYPRAQQRAVQPWQKPADALSFKQSSQTRTTVRSRQPLLRDCLTYCKMIAPGHTQQAHAGCSVCVMLNHTDHSRELLLGNHSRVHHARWRFEDPASERWWE